MRSRAIVVVLVGLLGSCGVEDADEESVEQDVTGPAADYVVTALSPPPASALTGESFQVTVTVANTGTVDATVASLTKFALSSDLAVGFDKWLTTSASVPPLAVGATDTQTVTLAIPTLAGGTYHLLACADRNGNVVETSNANNCTFAASPIVITGADLVVSSLSEPPAALVTGQTIAITSTVDNIGTGAATAASRTKYALTTDPGVPTYKWFSATTLVPALAAGASDTQTTTLKVPSAPAGTYYLLACADRAKKVAELDDTNNCRFAATQITVTGADLVVSAVSEPASRLDVGETFAITDTVTNAGTAAAASTFTTYYLSPFPGKGTGSFKLATKRSTGALAIGATSTGTVTATVPAVPDAFYYVVACADGGGQVVETDDKNNCRASVGQAAIGVAGGEMTITSVARTDGYTQAAQGTFVSLVVTGTGLDLATGLSLGGDLGTIVSATPDELFAEVYVGHGATPGPVALTLTSPDGTATYPGALEITPWIVTTDGSVSETAPCTYEAPCGLCRLGGLGSSAGDTMLISSGAHVCGDVVEIGGGDIIGAGVGVTTIEPGLVILDGVGSVRDMTITTTNPAAIYTVLPGTNLALSQLELVGGGVEVTGPATGALTMTDVAISSCDTGLRLTAGSATLDHVTIAGCTRGLWIGTTPVGANPQVTVTAGDLVDNGTGVAILDGRVTLTDTTIRDDTATPATCGTGVGITNGRLVMTGGSISGQTFAGVDAYIGSSSLEYRLFATITGATITGGAYGVRFGGYPDAAGLTVQSSVVQGQTAAAVSWAIRAQYPPIFVTDDQLSVVSGYALDLPYGDMYPDTLVHASGTTFNGNSYSGLVVGPADVAPDYRMVDNDVAIQF